MQKVGEKAKYCRNLIEEEGENACKPVNSWESSLFPTKVSLNSQQPSFQAFLRVFRAQMNAIIIGVFEEESWNLMKGEITKNNQDILVRMVRSSKVDSILDMLCD